MIRAILIDDEKHCLRTLEISLKKTCPEVEILASCDNPEDGIAQIENSDPDLLFLDIEMPRINGFELLEKFVNIDFDIVFTTAYDQYALNAFRVSAVDYLMKPISEKELRIAVDKVIENRKKALDSVEKILSQVKKQYDTELKKIPIPTSRGIDFVMASDIIYCQAESNYTFIHFSDNKKKVVARTLKSFEELLPSNIFFRSHQSYIVNLHHVKTYMRTDGGYLIMSNKDKIAISRAKREAFLKRF